MDKLVIGVLAVVIAVSAFYYGYTSMQGCAARGGTIVRGLIGFECVEGK